MSTPQIPQRPARSQQVEQPSQQPQVPARPARSVERSLNRDTSSRSPLNFNPSDRNQVNNVSGNSIRRPPSVAALPSIGNEGDEYGALDSGPSTASESRKVVMDPSTTSHVAHDMPLHAPKASIPASDRQRIAGVTRTDSAKASVAGVGKPTTEYSAGDVSHRPRSRADRPPSAYSSSRPASVSYASDHHDEDEHGIPEIGVRVPMYPNAGDVQAPTPGPGPGTPASGIGFFNSGSRPVTSDGRRRSAQGFHVPPDAYGLHGHGVGPQDQFEQEWYNKHPEEREKELHGAHGPAVTSERHEWNLSSEQLNRLVHANAAKKSIGNREEANSTPSEAIGYAASDFYSSRANSPNPLGLHKTKSHENTMPAAESPLRRTSFPEGAHHYEPRDGPNDDVYHSEVPLKRTSRMSLRSNDGLDDFVEDASVLASDETGKRPLSGWQQPAVSPDAERHIGDEEYFSGVDSKGVPQYQKGYRSASRSRSRQAADRQGHALTRFASREDTGTPLGGIKEYDPLFADDDDKAPQKPVTHADRLKRPDLERHRFPSQDIWEDTPDSLRLETEVGTPEEPSALRSSMPASAVFEPPEQESARRAGLPLKPKFNPAVQKEIARPQMQHRFPSQDIWEDTPESAQLESEVETAQEAAAAEEEAATRQRPTIPERPKPTVPQRPARRSGEDPDAVIAREKPAVPARPAGGSAKFASIKAGFMSDLNSRLKLGPQASVAKQEEKSIEAQPEEAIPLSDARKSRARGPARRKPATAAAESETTSSRSADFSISTVQTVWSISPTGDHELLVQPSKMHAPENPKDAPMHAEGVYAHSPSPQLDALAAADDKAKRERLREISIDQIGHVGDTPDIPEDVNARQPQQSTNLLQKPAHAELTKAVGDLDHADPHKPSELNEEAEEERKKELADLGLPIASKVDTSAQTGEKHIKGGEALTGETVVSPEKQ